MSSNKFDEVFANMHFTGNKAKSLFDAFPDNIHVCLQVGCTFQPSVEYFFDFAVHFQSEEFLKLRILKKIAVKIDFPTIHLQLRCLLNVYIGDFDISYSTFSLHTKMGRDAHPTRVWYFGTVQFKCVLAYQHCFQPSPSRDGC